MSENQGDYEERLDQRRAVLLRPGDLLLIGNVGKDVDMEVLGSVVRCLKEDLGLSSVVIFEADVTLDSIGREEIERLMDKRKSVKGQHVTRRTDG